MTMLTPEERIMIGLKVLERLRPRLRDQYARLNAAFLERPEPHRRVEFQDPGSPPEASLVSLQDLLSSSEPLPPYSLVLGVCDDGLPFHLDLTNPAPGSLLLFGDSGGGMDRLLAAILDSLVLLNTIDQAQFVLASSKTEAFRRFENDGHCLGVADAYDASLETWVMELGGELENRRHSPDIDDVLVFAIHDLPACAAGLSEEAFVQLFRLIKHGPRARIWVIATMESDQIHQIDLRLQQAFRTLMVAPIASPEVSAYLVGNPSLTNMGLWPGYQFCTPFDGEWLSFWISELEEDLEGGETP